ncbi:hypothetical protein PLESTB_001078700 [Pleodorina starrii]|uniref:Uncharacterized protein n=1 Tax=Pleodorina starrii TaxID=330485 RepID=A0A9W6BRI2_9CHLO|nr:hypothetical protein PLESTM_001180400 [Pleodorina starrii]GLC56196.1 hypothetical protein PLESTB_001078700 [Pleodorina starrii]GLC74917.1 hypothetical protein PLESTF_001572900 [Pleodorina starrii]
MAPEKIDASAGPVSDASTASSWAERWEKTKIFIVKNYLPLAFLVALAAALAWPVPGRFLANVSILGNVRICQVAAMVLVFLITGLQLNTSELKRALALRNLPVVVYGFVAILIATPCLGFALRSAPLDPWEFATGLAIFCVAPTTLGVGVALTEACGGNRAMALLLTVGTNALAVFTMPPELRLLLPPGHGGSGGGDKGPAAAAAAGAVMESASALNVDVQVTDLLVKLAVTVLVPFTIGKVVREVWPAAEGFVKARRVPLSLLSTSALAFVVWQTLSAARDLLLAQRPGPVFAMIGLAVAMHVAYLVANYLIVWFVLRAPLREAIAVVIMSSQKSAPVAVTTITFMTRDAAQQGLLSLPAIVGQMAQIFIGAALAKWLYTMVERAEQREKAEAQAAAAEAQQAVQAGGAEAAAEAEAAAATSGELQLAAPAPASTAAACTERDLERNANRAEAAAVAETAAYLRAPAAVMLPGSGDLCSITIGGRGGEGGGSCPAEPPSLTERLPSLGAGASTEVGPPGSRWSTPLEAQPPFGRLAPGPGRGSGGSSSGGGGGGGRVAPPLEALPQLDPLQRFSRQQSYGTAS